MLIVGHCDNRIVPGLGLLSHFYLKDKYNPEPLAIFPIMFIHYVLSAENIIPGPFIESFISVGLLRNSQNGLFYISPFSGMFPLMNRTMGSCIGPQFPLGLLLLKIFFNYFHKEFTLHFVVHFCPFQAMPYLVLSLFLI